MHIGIHGHKHWWIMVVYLIREMETTWPHSSTTATYHIRWWLAYQPGARVRYMCIVCVSYDTDHRHRNAKGKKNRIENKNALSYHHSHHTTLYPLLNTPLFLWWLVRHTIMVLWRYRYCVKVWWGIGILYALKSNSQIDNKTHNCGEYPFTASYNMIDHDR